MKRLEFVRLITLSSAALTFSCTSSFVKKTLIIDANCTGCGACLAACSFGAIILPEKSIFTVRPEACTGCGRCLTVCPEQALIAANPGYSVISADCNGCGHCIEACPEKALTLDPAVYSITSQCSKCGLCVAACPRGAISKQQGAFRIDTNLCDRCGLFLNVCR
ncbi:MAG: 4Fe-4S dicluster domain-containing protein, partial [Chrysiogenales bacterium]